jgi:hypothetical protein
VHAQDIAQRLQLSADVTLLSAHYVHDSAGGRDALGAAVGGSRGYGLGLLSPGNPISGIGLGYALDAHWVPSLGVSVWHADPGFGSGPATSWSVRPGVRYVFAEHASVRPFVGGALAYGHDDFGIGGVTSLGASVNAGLQLPLGDRASLDPFARLAYGHAHQKGESDEAAGFYAAAIDDHVFDLSGGFALSLWL